jgi:hypothetical protein
VDAHRVVRCRGSQMVLRLSAFLPLGRSLVLIFVKGWVNPRDIVWLKRLGQLKIQWPHQESNPQPPDLYHSASTVSQLSQKCGSLHVSWPYGPSQSVTGIALTLGGGGGDGSEGKTFLISYNGQLYRLQWNSHKLCRIHHSMCKNRLTQSGSFATQKAMFHFEC